MSLPASKAPHKKELVDPLSLGAWRLLVQVNVEGDKNEDKYGFSAFPRKSVLTELYKKVLFHCLHLKASFICCH